MEGLMRCQVCEKYISSTKEGRAIHMKRYHGVTVRREMKKLTPEEKAVLVDRGERKIGLQHFIFPNSLTVNVAEVAFMDPLIPARYCDPDGSNICMWVKHGFEICAPCAVRKEWEDKQMPMEDIDYKG